MWFLVSDPSPLFFFFLFLFVFILSFLSLFFLRKSNNNHPKCHQEEDLSRNGDDPSLVSRSLSKLIEETEFKGETESARSLLLDIFSGDGGGGDPGRGSGEGDGSGGGRVRKKKKRARKKRLELKEGSGDCERGEKGQEEEQEDKNKADSGRTKPELVCLYPFTSTSSATQRKIKQQYDQLVKCNETRRLTLAQVGEFANCLIKARNELQQKSEVIKRKFTIARALLFKADRSSIDRVRQQIFKLELEQKRLEEDAFVYNWLQQQLKLSPAYKKMVEISSCLELKAKSDVLVEHNDPEFSDISFEELLAQEKKDSFWQKNGKSRSHLS